MGSFGPLTQSSFHHKFVDTGWEKLVLLIINHSPIHLDDVVMTAQFRHYVGLIHCRHIIPFTFDSKEIVGRIVFCKSDGASDSFKDLVVPTFIVVAISSDGEEILKQDSVELNRKCLGSACKCKYEQSRQ